MRVLNYNTYLGVVDELRIVGKTLGVAAVVHRLVFKNLIKAIGAASSLTNPLTFHFYKVVDTLGDSQQRPSTL